MDKSGAHRVTIGAYPATSGSITVPVHGMVMGIGILITFGTVYSTSLSVEIEQVNDNEPDLQLFQKSSMTTGGWFYPVQQLGTNAGALVSAQYTFGTPAFGNVEINVTGAQPGDIVDVTFLVDE